VPGGDDLQRTFVTQRCWSAQTDVSVAIVVGGETCYYEVVVANPASKSCLAYHRPDIIPLTAAKLVERSKLQKYRKVFNSNNLEGVANNVIPFALESTSRMGKYVIDSILMMAKLKAVVPDPNPRQACVGEKIFPQSGFRGLRSSNDSRAFSGEREI
jgi:hypothetical protein